MKNRVHQLKRLADLKQLEIDRAAQQLRSIQTLLEREQEQLLRLQKYQQDYFDQQDSKEAAQPQLMAMRQHFLKQLRQSVFQQTEVVRQAETRFMAAKDQWFSMTKVKDQLMQRAQEAQCQHEMKQNKQHEEHVQTFLQHRRSTD